VCWLFKETNEKIISFSLKYNISSLVYFAYWSSIISNTFYISYAIIKTCGVSKIINISDKRIIQYLIKKFPILFKSFTFRKHLLSKVKYKFLRFIRKYPPHLTVYLFGNDYTRNQSSIIPWYTHVISFYFKMCAMNPFPPHLRTEYEIRNSAFHSVKLQNDIIVIKRALGWSYWLKMCLMSSCHKQCVISSLSVICEVLIH
jgi:hypothetical protein